MIKLCEKCNKEIGPRNMSGICGSCSNKLFPRGVSLWRKGTKNPEHAEKIAKSLTGKKLSEEHKAKLRGKIRSEEYKRNISLRNKGRKQSPESIEKRRLKMIGHPVSQETRRKIGFANGGERSYLWKGGMTSIHKKIRRSSEYREWREAVFKRDDWTCQECGKRGGIELHPHHKKSFSEYPDLRFDISNGITLCADCHYKTDNFGTKSWRKRN